MPERQAPNRTPSRERVVNPLALRYLLWFSSSLLLDVALGAVVVWQVTSLNKALAAAMLVSVQVLSAAAAPLVGRFVDAMGLSRSLWRVALARIVLAGLLALALHNGAGGGLLLVLSYAAYAVLSTALRLIEQIALQFVVSQAGWARMNAVHGVLYDAAWALGPVLGMTLVQYQAAKVLPLLLAAVSVYVAYYAVAWARGWSAEVGASKNPNGEGLPVGLVWVVRYIAARPVLVRTILLGMMWNAFYLGPITLLLPLVIQERGLPPLAYGLLSGAWPLGFMVGIAVGGHRIPPDTKAQKMLAWYALLLAVQGFVVVLMTVSKSLAWMVGWYAFAGLVTGPTDVIVKLIRQHEVPVNLQGRYIGLGGLVGPLAAATGVAAVGASLPHFSANSLLKALALCLSVVALVTLFWPVGRSRTKSS